jgi:sulfoxide reductase heme-binding subunit YedZ
MAKAPKKANLLWLVLISPGCYLVAGYVTGHLTYGQFIHATGDWSAWLLMATLAVTPLRLMFRRAAWPGALLRRRRYLGVASFLYAVPHVAAYVIRLPGERILGEAFEPGMLAGWIAFAIFLPLAVTSNDAAVRALGAKWKILHRFVYLAAVLTFTHWVMTAFDPTVGALHLGALAALECYRVWATRR